MSITFENFKLKRIIVHEIFTRETDSVPPEFNDTLVDLNADAILELQKRIMDAVAHGSQCIQMDIEKTDASSAYALMAPFLDITPANDLFVAMSKLLTERLASFQTSRNIPGGAVVVFDGTITGNNRNCVGVIKAEKHSGFSMQTQNNVKILEFFDNLLLTPQQKLYKIGFLVDIKDNATLPRKVEDSEMYVFDSSNSKSTGKIAANYFYDNFLGCTYKRNSAMLTKEFFEHSKEFFTKKSKMSGEDIVNSVSALHTYLKVDKTPLVSVDDFGQKYLPDAATQDSYSTYMQSKKVPITSFQKNTDLIKNKLGQRKLKFSNDIRIYAPSENFDENVKIVKKTDISTLVEIKGHVTTEE